MTPRFAVATSTSSDTAGAVAEALARVEDRLDGVDLLFVYATAAHDRHALAQAIPASIPRVAGGTTCRGVLTPEGAVMGTHVVACLAIKDPDGTYGIGGGPLGEDPRAAASRAIEQALADGGRPWLRPELVWVFGAPGSEESVLQGIHDVLPGVDVLGGSSADDHVRGAWWQHAGRRHWDQGVSVAIMAPSHALQTAFQSGYRPTAHSARVTQAEGRRVIRLDEQPAKAIYDAWTDGRLAALSEGDSCLSETALAPLGRVSGRLGRMPQYLLAHPAHVGADGALELFASVEVGEQLTLMAGSRESLLPRGGRAILRAREQLDGPLGGVLLTYCAGCMLAVEDDVDAIATHAREAAGDVPFLGVFTFGEQGPTLAGQSRHGNLMVGAAAFGCGA